VKGREYETHGIRKMTVTDKDKVCISVKNNVRKSVSFFSFKTVEFSTYCIETIDFHCFVAFLRGIN
jgi:hypothetical protein